MLGKTSLIPVRLSFKQAQAQAIPDAPRTGLREISYGHEPSEVEEAVHLVPRPMEQQLQELHEQIKLMPQSIARENLAEGLRRLLRKASNAQEMSLLLKAIQAEDPLLAQHPRLLLALADQGPILGRHDTDLVQDITACCLRYAHTLYAPLEVWTALSDCTNSLPPESRAAMAQAMAPYLRSMAVNARLDFFYLCHLLTQRQLLAPESDRELFQRAEGLAALLDNNHVSTEAQWQTVLSQVDQTLLQASPNLRTTLTAKFLSSPGISPSQVADVATLCVGGDPSGHYTQSVWRFFSYKLQSGTLAPERAQQLLDSLIVVQHLCPESEQGEFRKAQRQFAQQLQGLDA